ncbi:nucleotide sugar epimerase [Paenibacillus sp. 598K]|uniref:alpha/beta fold hydrolase n=1 Tax=Paenibacillus sp. 598K TaxID=1117987 RepID=UPI000FFAD38C|nr:alpha/beta fold hydrolase [Paenibacillus sp. 598K]GBF76393.1 nucleotide sugar epimerase [Paenibacillus sp. 598K]
MKIFITGGTGYIGKRLLAKLAPYHQIYTLVRQESRLRNIIDQLPDEAQANILPVIGDLAKPRLGLSDADYQQVLTVDQIIHAGGPMNIELSLTEAEQSFLYPAQSMAQLALAIHAAKGLQQFIHVAGFMSPYDEQNGQSDLSDQLALLPPYEQMKFRADGYIRQSFHGTGIPLSTVNPSVIVGDSFTGQTEQLGGLGILVDAVRRNLMPLVPGGDDVWLPMVHIDHVVSFIDTLVHTEDAESNTYYLLDAKKNSPSIRALIQGMTKELRTAPPRGAIPLPILKTALGLGGGKLLGIPKESMNFLVKSDFPVASKLEAERRTGTTTSLVTPTLPFIVSDLDYRLNHAGAVAPQGQESFSARRRGDLITLENDLPGTPLIFLHGTFSSADTLWPVSSYLSSFRTLFVDLPGFGRTPYHHSPDVIEGYVERVSAMIAELDQPVILIGHSFGGFVAARVMERLPALIDRLLLLQPVLHPVPARYRFRRLTQATLKHMKPAGLEQHLLRSRSFTSPGHHLEAYVQRVRRDLRSPRIRATNAAVMAALTMDTATHLSPDAWDTRRVKILWGTQDRDHHIPKSFEHLNITRLPLGHQFPIEFPERTAEWIGESVTSRYLGKVPFV